MTANEFTAAWTMGGLMLALFLALPCRWRWHLAVLLLAGAVSAHSCRIWGLG